MNRNPIKCDICGKFISYSDLDLGLATYRMITPDSDVSYETWETLCREHKSIDAVVMKEKEKSMTLEVVKGQPDVFIKDSQFAYKLGKIYDVLISEKTYCAGSCLGHMRVIVENSKVLQWIYPLMSAGEFQLVDSTKIEKYRKIVETYDTTTKINIP